MQIFNQQNFVYVPFITIFSDYSETDMVAPVKSVKSRASPLRKNKSRKSKKDLSPQVMQRYIVKPKRKIVANPGQTVSSIISKLYAKSGEPLPSTDDPIFEESKRYYLCL